MKKIRVLVVDDSALIRRIVCDAISAETDLEVVGIAQNGRIALDLLDRLRPDIVTMDIEMPILSGLDTLPELRQRFPQLPVIMFSTLTVAGCAATLDALARGASDFATKPSGPGGLADARTHVQTDLIPKIRALVSRRKYSTPPASLIAKRRPVARVDCVVIGISTGGPRALETLLPALPSNFPVPVLIVQHMPPTFTRQLAERLNNLCRLSVCEAEHGQSVGAGSVVIAPGQRHLTVARERGLVNVVLTDDPPEHSCRPSACVMFRSALHVYGANLLAVVMTGMGEDGSDGAADIFRAGGQVIGQDEASSVVWGMPGAVARAGVIDALIPLDGLAGEIARLVGVGRSVAPSVPANAART